MTAPHPSLQHPGRWLWLVLLVPIGLGLWRLSFDTEVLDLLPSDLPTVQGLKIFQEHFANARELILTVQTQSAEESERAARSIAERLREETNLVSSVIWQPPWLEHPELMAELMGYLWFNLAPQEFDALAQRLEPQKLSQTLAETRDELANSLSPQEIARLSYDPFGLTRLPEKTSGAAPSFEGGQEMFGSPDGTFRIIFIQAKGDLRSYKDCDQWLSEVKAVVASVVSGMAEVQSLKSTDHGAEDRGQRSEVRGQKSEVSSQWSVVSGPHIGYTGRPAFVSEAAMGMQHDVKASVGGTAAIIAMLFWLAHRRIKPMLWLLTLLGLTLGSTLALGGLIYGKINIVSVGFAAILLGLAVDYAVVHYQEALAQPELSIPQIRHAIAPSIFWAAVTTISAFLVLNFGGLPGLGQLGTLVALGVALAAGIMIFEFLPPLFPQRAHGGAGPGVGGRGWAVERASAERQGTGSELRDQGSGVAFGVTVVLLLLSLATLLVFGRPAFDPTANALRPRNSIAYETLEKVQAHLAQGREPLSLVIAGRRVEDVARTLTKVDSILSTAVSNNLIAGFKLPALLWPEREYQEKNRATARRLAAERPVLRQTALTNGFAQRALALTDHILDTWQRASESQGLFWPTNPMSRWIFGKFFAQTSTNFFVMGVVEPAGERDTAYQNENTKHQTPNTRETSNFKLQTSNKPQNSNLKESNSIGLQKPGSETDQKSVVRGQRSVVGQRSDPLAVVESMLPAQDVWLSGWSLLGGAIFQKVKSNFWKVLAPMVILVLLSLWLAFRKRPLEKQGAADQDTAPGTLPHPAERDGAVKGGLEIALSLSVLLLSGLCLLTVMRWAHWSWNLLNLMSVPLILGTGVDYSIFMQLALRRFNGDRRMAYRAVGRALLLCGGTAVAGFGSLSLSSNQGMASLGQVCAVGIGANMLISVLLLPGWWGALSSKFKVQGSKLEEGRGLRVERRGAGAGARGEGVQDATRATEHDSRFTIHVSRFYRARLWRLGLQLVRLAPTWLLKVFCLAVAELHFRLSPQRRQIVINNLLPAHEGQHALAKRTARRLYRNFALKLVDLWRVESGLPLHSRLSPAGDLKLLESALGKGRGVVLVTVHLGNWELGGLLLAQLGVKLTVLTLAEPDANLTELRAASRARLGIDTLVIGHDGFEFVEVIKRLQAGGAVAILLDRPRERNSAHVQLFGHSFSASAAAADLARASGCALIGVAIVREGPGYVARILPELNYDHRTLVGVEGRRALTQQILERFEPEIRAHLDQWYQFVPVWPRDAKQLLQPR
ncbi:MAG: hypothetical protein C5B50_14435 [Verrucomicrobia bacterium]|nr:MAG: hypothetical protein C5B50_14435 [Verrucomicrobiota bacterium]